jgi:hypothetical protein
MDLEGDQGDDTKRALRAQEQALEVRARGGLRFRLEVHHTPIWEHDLHP